MLIGYARVSKNEQNLDLQRDALIKAGCSEKNIFTDKITGTKAVRIGLEQALSHLRVNVIKLVRPANFHSSPM